MKISVVISNFNYSHYIEEAVESILSNDKEYLKEIIIVDDGSIDDSHVVLEQLHQKHDKVRLIKKENGGQFSCFRKGIEVA